MFNFKKYFCRENAQTAIELAVFGSILIFVVGMIVRQALGTGYLQNQNLKAMRLALLTSHEYSEGLKGPPDNPDAIDGVASRNSASVLLIEDRLVAESNRYGAIDRFPQIVSGSGTHSRNLFLPVEAGEDWNIPVLDVFVNGKHFILQIGKLISVNLTTTGWIPDCGIKTVPNIPPPPDFIEIDVGCSLLYTIIPNHPENDDWCNGGDISCPSDGNLPVEERFNLARGLPGFDEANVENPELREIFSWQWGVIAAVDRERTDPNVVWNYDETLKTEQSINLLVDVDEDLKEERIMKLGDVDGNGAFKSMQVMDFQEGDIDFTRGSSDLGEDPGFNSKVQMWTFTDNPDTDDPGDNTYLIIEQGELFSSQPGRQYVRSVQKKDSIDIIQRELVLSNDNGRFCDGPGAPAGDVDGEENPVEVCCANRACCFDPILNWNQTCMITGDPTDIRIFIRSRLKDIHGRKWITDVTDDTDIDFVF